MELANKEYIKLSIPDIYVKIVEAVDENDKLKLDYFQDFASSVRDYEK